MVKIAVPLAFIIVSCSPGPAARVDRFAAARAVVTSIAGKRQGLVRLTIHAVPTGETESRIVACNVLAKRGKPSDPEDLQATKTLETVVLRDGDDLDVTAPIPDEKARAIARELTEAVRSAEGPLW